MHRAARSVHWASLVLALLGAAPAHAASCCGGGAAASILLPKERHLMLDLSLSEERYDGFWRRDGTWVPDPPDSDLRQYRFSIALAQRLADNWQLSLALPHVWNQNRYSGLDSHTHGIGDAMLALWYEGFDNPTCVYRVRSAADLLPAVYWGTALTVPTGTSPYDEVRDNFDITGRGFYRLDLNLLLDKTVYPWTTSLQFSYGIHAERPVNRDYGSHIEPYDKQLGDRMSWSLAAGYIHFTADLHELTTLLSYSEVDEQAARIDGAIDPTSGFRKSSITLSVAWSNAQKDWIVKGSLNRSPRADGWGEHFPRTTTLTFGVSHVLH